MKSIKKLVKFIQKSKLTELEESIFRARLISDIDITLEDFKMEVQGQV